MSTSRTSTGAPAGTPDGTADEPLARHSHAALVTAGLGGAWVVLRDHFPVELPCPMLSATGVPCPLCGMTRLSEHLLHGEVTHAVTVDPAGVAFLVILTLLALVGVASRIGWSSRRWPTASPVLVLLVATLSVHWMTTLLGGGFVRT